MICSSVKLLDLAVAAGDELADVAHPRALAEDDVVARQGDQGGHAEGAVVDEGDGLHVLDAGDRVGDGVGGRVDSARAVDLEEDEVDLLLPGLLDPADSGTTS